MYEVSDILVNDEHISMTKTVFEIKKKEYHTKSFLGFVQHFFLQCVLHFSYKILLVLIVSHAYVTLFLIFF